MTPIDTIAVSALNLASLDLHALLISQQQSSLIELESLLCQLNLSVDTAIDDGQDFTRFETISPQQYQLVFVEINLSNEDVFSSLKRIRRLFIAQLASIIAIVPQSPGSLTKEGYRLGLNGLLYAPVNRLALIEAIQATPMPSVYFEASV